MILTTGDGGSIGFGLCRQLAKMQPRQIIILDIYENGAYYVQQKLKNIPLMERNCVKAVQNNVFGTKNVIDCCEKY